MLVEVKNLKEVEYVSATGKEYLNSSAFGRCEIISKAEARKEMDGNECFYPCDTIKGSKYVYYVDEEIMTWYAVRK